MLADAVGEMDESTVWSGVIHVPPGLLLPIPTVEPVAPEARISITAEPVAPPEPSPEPLTPSPTPVKPRRILNTAPVVIVASGRSLPRAYAARRRFGDQPKPAVAEALPATEKESDVIVAQPVAVVEPEALATTEPVAAPEPARSDQVSVDEPDQPPPAGRTVTIPLPPTHLRPVPSPGSERPALLVVIVALSIAAAALAYRQLGSGRDGRPASSGNGAPASVTAAPPPPRPRSMPVRIDSNPQTPDTLPGSSTDSVAADSSDSQTPGNQPGDSADAAVVQRPRSELPASVDSAREAVVRRRVRIDSMARAMKTP